eukprot:m.26733 g.26733  ORF g.26733 m.26733 type:complete len:289 (+) comp11704_c0_seq2:40-906(+)
MSRRRSSLVSRRLSIEEVREYSVGVALEQYSDENAVSYQRSKFVPWREYCERPLADALLGDVKCKSILDLACGEGHYTRWLKQHKHVEHVIGVDLSPDMIALAQAQEDQTPLGINYICSDAAELKLDEDHPVDLVFAAYLLNYFASSEDLVQMLTVVYNLLPPGGRFVAINNNPEDVDCHHPELRKYHVTKTCEFPGQEGAVIQFSFFDDDVNSKDPTLYKQAADPMCVVDNYFLSRERHEEAFKAAGFTEVSFHHLQPSEEGQSSFPDGYWDELMAAQPVCGMVALK